MFADFTSQLSAVLRDFLPDLPDPFADRLPRSVPQPASLAVTEYLPMMAQQAPTATRSLVAGLCVLAPSLSWRQTYCAEMIGRDFLANYGWCELAGPNGVIVADDLSVGLLLLGPDTVYPLHSHSAVETYLPLSGSAEWFASGRGNLLSGERQWREVPPLTAVHHPSGIEHAMRTDNQPLLAFFHWSGENIHQSARLSLGNTEI